MEKLYKKEAASFLQKFDKQSTSVTVKVRDKDEDEMDRRGQEEMNAGNNYNKNTKNTKMRKLNIKLLSFCHLYTFSTFFTERSDS